jgi:sarcosine oxidase subunit beta
VTRTADVVIIGGGVTGVSVAFHLAGAGVRRVVVLERRFLASGGTGRSVGIVRQLYPTAETSAMVRRSLTVFQHFADAVGGDAGYVACGALIGVSAAMRPKLEANLAMQRGLGIRAEILDPEDVARVEPAIDPAGLGGVLWEPESGYGDPTAVTLAYADAARRRGVTIEQGVEVTAIRVEGDHVRGVETATGAIDAPIVVNAAGLWSPAVARLAGVTLPIVIGRHPVFIVQREEHVPAHRVYLDLAAAATCDRRRGTSRSRARSPTTRPSIRWIRSCSARRPASRKRAWCSSAPGARCRSWPTHGTAAATRAPSTSPRTGCRFWIRRVQPDSSPQPA